MKNRLFPLTIASLFALAQPAFSQEKTTPTPTPTSSPTATPSPSPTPAPAATPDLPEASPQPAASPDATATPDADAASAASPAPAASPAAKADAKKDAKADADFLPEPTDASLGAPIEPNPDAALPTNEVAPSDVPNPDNLIPQGTADSDNAPPAPAKPVENKFEQDRKLQVRYQQVKLQALKDADIRSLHEQADAAKTDEMKRQALREYYRLLFAKMTAIDGTLKDKCDVMQQAYLRRLGQYRVSPSIPLHPPPTPEPLAN